MKKLRVRIQGTDKYVISLLDDEDYEWAKEYTWVLDARPRCGYVLRRTTVGSRRSGRKNKIYFLHKLINKTPDGFHTDHINRNKLDNRKENLRTVTARENAHNLGVGKKNKSGYKGVSFYGAYNKWRAGISHKGAKYFIGYYDTAIEAAKAYDTAAIELNDGYTTNQSLGLFTYPAAR